MKYTNCTQLTLSDYQDSVIDNLINNLKENKNNNHQHLNESFEIVLKKHNNTDINDIKQNDNHLNKNGITNLLSRYKPLSRMLPRKIQLYEIRLEGLR